MPDFNERRSKISKADKKAASQAVHIRSLKVFYDVVRKRSFSHAAVEHGMTQSAASQSVQHLEEFLGVKLIDRTKRPFVMTAEGQKFFDGLSGFCASSTPWSKRSGPETTLRPLSPAM